MILATLFWHIWLEWNSHLFLAKYLSTICIYYRINNTIDLWIGQEQTAQKQSTNSRLQRMDLKTRLDVINLAVQEEEDRQEENV